eukprot:TRINITY_DN49367_c0_g1_i1.p1 TRINITY_DN49367_c0_g1~~TRINITY_DN49367_c0_g1_i1.p1  ORF type:complete len:318 (-),score=40.04 TRINITY_DN49367_c0_g1_i1:234-1187(-)
MAALPPGFQLPNSNKVCIASVGDVHGRFNAFISLLQQWEQQHHKKIDMVIQVGDIEPHRDAEDLKTMACPAKKRQLGDFHEVYSGAVKIPWPTLFIGGNHECYGHLEEDPNGFELCPNLYYMGRYSLVHINHADYPPLAVGGLSGIYRVEQYNRERPPIHLLPYKSNRDWIGFTCGDVACLKSVAEDECEGGKLDILVTHDWPSGVCNDRAVLGPKADSNRPIGNDAARELLDTLRPTLMLCGHMHTPFRTVVAHPNVETATQVCCLGKVPMQSSIAVFELNQADKTFTELPGLSKGGNAEEQPDSDDDFDDDGETD